MCLTMLEPKVTFQEYGTYYKVFRKWGARIKFFYNGRERLPTGKWLYEGDHRAYRHKGNRYLFTSGVRDEGDYIRIRVLNNELKLDLAEGAYPYGFHCYTNKKDAIYHTCNRIYKIEHNYHLAVYKVKVNNIVAQGVEARGLGIIEPYKLERVIVAKKLKIIGEINE